MIIMMAVVWCDDDDDDDDNDDEILNHGNNSDGGMHAVGTFGSSPILPMRDGYFQLMALTLWRKIL